LVAETLEDAKRIDDMNDSRQKAIKKSRIKHVKTHGKTLHHEFSDVQQLRSMQITQAYSNQMKGKGGG